MERVVVINHLDSRAWRYPTYWIGSYDECEVRASRGAKWVMASHTLVTHNKEHYRDWGRLTWGLCVVPGEPERNEYGECAP